MYGILIIDSRHFVQNGSSAGGGAAYKFPSKIRADSFPTHPTDDLHRPGNRRKPRVACVSTCDTKTARCNQGPEPTTCNKRRRLLYFCCALYGCSRSSARVTTGRGPSRGSVRTDKRNTYGTQTAALT